MKGILIKGFFFKMKFQLEFYKKEGVDHETKVLTDTRPSRRPLYQLSPAELQEAKEYIEKRILKTKKRTRNPPFGVPLFFVKHSGEKPFSVVDYRELNRIEKKRKYPLPRYIEIFDWVDGSYVFSKIYLKGKLAFVKNM